MKSVFKKNINLVKKLFSAFSQTSIYSFLDENKIKILIFLTVFILLLSAFFYSQNSILETTLIEYENEKITKDFDGYKIVHLSDLHNKSFGYHQKRLIDKIKKLEPDIIVYTGDIVTRYHKNVKNAEIFIEEISKICPVYYVTGNHEKYSRPYYTNLKFLAKEKGIRILNDGIIEIKKGNSSISLLGVKDYVYITNDGYTLDERSVVFNRKIKELVKESKSDFKILLSHRPEKFEDYVEARVDLVFSGHAHGGQFILPYIGGVYAPSEGFNPTYYTDTYEKNGCTMVVSRGLGNSEFPLRLNNRPEIILVTLKQK